MLDRHQFDEEYSIKCLEANRHNHITATYHLLYKKAVREKAMDKSFDFTPKIEGPLLKQSNKQNLNNT